MISALNWIKQIKLPSDYSQNLNLLIIDQIYADFFSLV